jgi:hypothetical protein
MAFACAKPESASAPSPDAAKTPAPTATSAAETSAATSATSGTAPAPTPAAGGAIATADGETAGVTATVKELKRSSGGTVSLKFVITNGSNKKLYFGYDFGDPGYHIGDNGSIGGVQLIDPVGKKKYFVARDSEEKCVCSRGLHDMDTGASVNMWAKFPAPPNDVQKISVVIPHFSPMDDVPISQ